jgi:hypothetical protein
MDLKLDHVAKSNNEAEMRGLRVVLGELDVATDSFQIDSERDIWIVFITYVRL